MGTELVKSTDSIGAIENALIGGDLSQLSEKDRLSYYRAVCESLRLNPLTKPFDYIELNGKLTLYAKRDCTDQLRKTHLISVKIVSREVLEGVFVVTAKATTPEGREDESVGAVPLVKEGGSWKTTQGGKRFFEPNGELVPIRPDDRANAIMKAETKAKRRVTLSICGLGLLDESEFDTIGELRSEHQASPERAAEDKTKFVPKELAAALVSIDKNTATFPTACERVAKLLGDKHGSAGAKAYDDIVIEFSERFPKGCTDKEAMKQCIRDMWNALQKDVGKLNDQSEPSPASGTAD